MTPTMLVFHAGPAAGHRVPVDRRLVVGREGADVTIADAQLSRRHATVDPSPDWALVVTDLGSTNGTWVNGARIAGPTGVRPGDEVRMGDSAMRAEAATPAVPAAPYQPFGAFAAAPVTVQRGRRAPATRLRAGLVLTWLVLALDAVALLVYFAAR